MELQHLRARKPAVYLVQSKIGDFDPNYFFRTVQHLQKILSRQHSFCPPTLCTLCSHYHKGAYAVCENCHGLLHPLIIACSICRFPLIDNTFPLCGNCIRQKPVFDKVLTAYQYEEPLRGLLHEFKYHKALYLRSFMVKLMLDALPAEPYQPDCLIPVPMHASRLRQRGFNQAAELTKLLAKRLGTPYELNLCKKIINTAPQAQLNRKQRQSNLNKAFSAVNNTYRHITLVDDLLTTGSTANELAALLKSQGATRVDIWCCARTC